MIAEQVSLIGCFSRNNGHQMFICFSSLPIWMEIERSEKRELPGFSARQLLGKGGNPIWQIPKYME